MAGESLKVIAGNATGSSIGLENELVIGRSTPGLGSLGGDSEISRVHARIYNDPQGQLMVEDLGSTNGTFVNGNRISGAQALRGGDQVRVGQTTMTVEGGAGEGATTVGQVVPAPVPLPPAAPAAAQPPPTQQLPPTQPLPPAQPAAAQYGGPQQPGFAGGPIGGPPGKASGGSKAPWIALAAVVAIALIVGGLAIGGVFGGDDDKKNTASTTAVTTPAPTTPAPAAEPPPEAAMPEPPPESSAPSGGGYPPGFVNKLVDSCAQGGKLSRSQCQCWFGKLKDAYTFPELVKVIKQAQGGSIPPKAVALLRTCLNS
jgi:predicted component of type VI protein secretion system